MTARNPLLASPPYAVEDSLLRLGQRLRTARLRRNLTVADVGKKIGTGSRAVADAEKGKPSTSVAVYAALLWAFDLIGDLDAVAAHPTTLKGSRWRSAIRAVAPARPEGSTMTSDGAATECFVYITLPGAIEPVTAGRFVQERQRSGMTLGRFVYGRSYLARQDAVVLAPVELKLSDRTYEGGILLNSSATQRHRGRYFRQSAQICKMRDVTRGCTLHNFNL